MSYFVYPPAMATANVFTTYSGPQLASPVVIPTTSITYIGGTPAPPSPPLIYFGMPVQQAHTHIHSHTHTHTTAMPYGTAVAVFPPPPPVPVQMQTGVPTRFAP